MNLVKTEDGSNTLFSKEFNQHYHNRKDGALNESLYKHIIPAIDYHKNKKELHILDICFGLGYNTLTTLYQIKKYNLDIKVFIYSPEIDKTLLENLKNFEYPKEFKPFENIIKSISDNFKFLDEKIEIELFNADAREYLDILYKKNIKIDIVYQDAFSSDVNKALWTKEYFNKVVKVLNKDSIITTYSVATPIRLAMWENGINIYQYESKNINKSTIGLNKKELDKNYKYIDMELKKQRNKKAKALSDLED